MDNSTVAAIAREIVEVGIDQGLTMVRLIEIKCSLDAKEIPVKVHASASGIEINVCRFGHIVVVVVSWCCILNSCCTKDGVEVVVEVSLLSAVVSATSLSS